MGKDGCNVERPITYHDEQGRGGKKLEIQKFCDACLEEVVGIAAVDQNNETMVVNLCIQSKGL